jgi:CBS domain-containing protein
MTAGKLCTRDVSTATRNTTVADAAKQMRHRHVGDVVVVEKNVPVGIVTDRDIVISVVATGLDPAVFTLGDLLLKEAIVCREDLDATACLQQMRTHAIRRMPVVDKSGILVGIITVDDLLRMLAGELGEVAKLIDREQVMEMKTRV